MILNLTTGQQLFNLLFHDLTVEDKKLAIITIDHTLISTSTPAGNSNFMSASTVLGLEFNMSINRL